MKIPINLGLFFLFLFLFLPITPQEFLYPVGYYRNEKTNYLVLYQKSLEHVELWNWNPITLRATKALLSTYIPAGVQILPNQQGFSFIDNGRIRIKYFAKRSPKTIDIFEPIYDISVIHWIDEDNFYFCAREHQRFCVYQANIKGELAYIRGDDNYDYLYPQKIGNSLFCIKRDFEQRHCIIEVPYPEIEFDSDVCDSLLSFDERVDLLLERERNRTPSISSENEAVVLTLDKRPIAFLSMISETEGFFVEHSSEVDRYDTVITFSYHHLQKSNNNWVNTQLFSFTIPLHYLHGNTNERLYESILPFLPRIMPEKGIFFEDCSYSNNLLQTDIFYFDFKTRGVEQKTNSIFEHQLFCAPLLFEDKYFFGGTLHSKNTDLGMFFDEQGELCFIIPCFLF